MGYATFKESPKSLVTSEQIGPGQIGLEHLSPALFAEIKKIAMHGHTGTGSRQIEAKNLGGYFGAGGILMYSSDGTKRYRAQINNSGAWVITEIT